MGQKGLKVIEFRWGNAIVSEVVVTRLYTTAVRFIMFRSQTSADRRGGSR